MSNVTSGHGEDTSASSSPVLETPLISQTETAFPYESPALRRMRNVGRGLVLFGALSFVLVFINRSIPQSGEALREAIRNGQYGESMGGLWIKLVASIVMFVGAAITLFVHLASRAKNATPPDK